MEENNISFSKNVSIIRYPPLPPNSVSGIKSECPLPGRVLGVKLFPQWMAYIFFKAYVCVYAHIHTHTHILNIFF